MSTYVIGDVQGCFDQLIKLLDKIHFDENKDILWFTGDLVNRGQQSLATLRFIKKMVEKKQAISVLGNHDFGLLVIARQFEPFDHKIHTFKDIIEAEDKEELLLFLEQLPLLYSDDKLGFTLVHAGIYPMWDLSFAKARAKEVEEVLSSDQKFEFYPHLYGNTPIKWDPTLTRFDRLRFIVNSFARMRFCTLKGELDFESKDSKEKAPENFIPWFKIPSRKTINDKIIFGHWAALNGITHEPNAIALDTGCVWGRCLTAFRLEDQKRFEVKCNL